MPTPAPKPLTIGDLRHMIRGLPASTPLVMTRCSDFGPMHEGDLEVIAVVRQQGGAYYRRYQKDQGPNLRPGETTEPALYFAGN